MSAPDFRFEPAPDLPGSDQLNKYVRNILRPIISRLWDVTITGAEHVPKTGAGLICPNHLSFSDSVFVPYALPRRMWAIGKAEYLDDWKTRHLFPAMGMIPIDRSGGQASQVALDAAAEVLEGGRLFMMYPEGTRSRSGHLHKARTGAARLSLRTGAPIIPVGHSGTLAVQPPDQFTMTPGLPVNINFGAPMFIQDHGDPADPRTIRVFADAVMFEIAQLSGQRYINTYAGDYDEVQEAKMRAERAKRTELIELPPGRKSERTALDVNVPAVEVA